MQRWLPAHHSRLHSPEPLRVLSSSVFANFAFLTFVPHAGCERVGLESSSLLDSRSGCAVRGVSKGPSHSKTFRSYIPCWPVGSRRSRGFAITRQRGHREVGVLLCFRGRGVLRHDRSANSLACPCSRVDFGRWPHTVEAPGARGERGTRRSRLRAYFL